MEIVLEKKPCSINVDTVVYYYCSVILERKKERRGVREGRKCDSCLLYNTAAVPKKRGGGATNSTDFNSLPLTFIK